MPACSIVCETHRLAVTQTMRIKMVFRDVDADGIIHDLFVSRPCHTRQGLFPPPLSVRVFRKGGNDPSSVRFFKTKPLAIHSCRPRAAAQQPGGDIRIARTRIPEKPIDKPLRRRIEGESFMNTT